MLSFNLLYVHMLACGSNLGGVVLLKRSITPAREVDPGLSKGYSIWSSWREVDVLVPQVVELLCHFLLLQGLELVLHP
jgi:hypothetical protein